MPKSIKPPKGGAYACALALVILVTPGAGQATDLRAKAPTAPMPASPARAERASSGPTDVHPFTVNALLGLEAIEAVRITPDGRRVIFERQPPWDRLSRYDLGFMAGWTERRLEVTDLAFPAPSRPLLVPDEGTGQGLGAFSPDGRRLLLHRWRDDRWEPGVLELTTAPQGRPLWSGLAGDWLHTGRAAQWRDPDHVLLLVRPDGGRPALIGRSASAAAAAARLAENGFSGHRPARIVVGSGRFAGDTPAAPPIRLVELDARDGGGRLLFEGDILDFEAAPGGRSVALILRGPAVPMDPDAPYRMNDTTERRRLVLVDLVDGRARRAPPDLDLSPNLFRWSPGGDELLVWARRDGQAWSQGGLIRISAADLGLHSVPTPGLEPHAQRGAGVVLTYSADWLGSTPVLYARQSTTDRYDWFRLDDQGPVNLTRRLDQTTPRLAAVQPASALMIADGAVWRLDARADRATRLTSSDLALRTAKAVDMMTPARLRVAVPDRADNILARGVDGALFRVFANGGRDLIRPAPASHPDQGLQKPADDTPFEVAAEAGDTVILRTVDQGVETLSAVRSGETNTLASANDDLALIDFARIETLSHPGLDGNTVTSRLYLPSGANRQPRGLVVIPYPGSTGASPAQAPGTFFTGLNAQILAGAGYAVLEPAMPLLPSSSAPRDGLADQVHLALDAALHAHPELDPRRVALAGHSFGGYAALAIACDSDRFASIIAMASTADLFSKGGVFDPVQRLIPEEGLQIRANLGWVEQGQGAMGAPPWRAPERYRRHSPLLSADRIQVPVLLIHGAMDFAPLAQAEEMFSALYRQDKDARLVTYHVGEHLLFSPADIRDMWSQIFDWLDRTLPPPPASSEPAPP